MEVQLGYYDYTNRYYDPSIGRFLQVDKLADHPNQVDKSVYAYAWNNPIALNDPDGNCPNCKTVEDWASFYYNALESGSEAAMEQSQLWWNPVAQYNAVVGIGKAVSDPKSTWQAIKQSAVNTYDKFMNGSPAEAGEVYGKVAVAVVEAAVGSKGAGLAGKIDDVTTLYRAVSKAELEDISKNGFRGKPGGGSFEGKLFANSLHDAKIQRSGGAGEHIISVDVSTSMYEKLRHIMMDEGAGMQKNTTAVDKVQLENFNKAIRSGIREIKD